MNRHTLAYASLSAVYSCTGAIFVLEGSNAHAICAFAAALIYAVASPSR
jgi:hypothetical protein